MFKASHVFYVKFNCSHDDFCLFDARVKASVTRNKIYRTKLQQKKTGKVMSVNEPVKLVLMDIVNMLQHYYISHLTSLKVASSKFPQILLA